MPVRKPNPVHRAAYLALVSRLRKWRLEANLTQRALAAKMGRPPTWVHKSETGERRLDVLEFLEWIHACDVDWKVAVQGIRRG